MTSAASISQHWRSSRPHLSVQGDPYVIQKEITRRIKACSTHAELRDLFSEHALDIQSLNKHQISASMMSMARLDARNLLERDGLQLGTLLLHRVFHPEVRETLAPRQASSILWAASAIGLRPDHSSIEVMLEKTLPSAAKPSSPPNSIDLSMILLSCSLLEYKPSPSWLERFERGSLQLLLQVARASTEYPGFNPSQQSHVLYSLASIRHTPSPIWLAAFSASSKSIMSKLDIPGLCGMAWAAGFHQRSVSSFFLWPEDSWVKEAVSTSLPLLPTMDSKHLASILWALARLQVSETSARPSIGQSPCIKERRPTKEWMDCFIDSSRRHAQAFDPRSISNLLYAIVELKYRPPVEWLDDMLSPLVSNDPPLASLQDVSSILRSCRSLGYLPSQPVMQAILIATYREMLRLDHLITVGSLSEEVSISVNALVSVLPSLARMRLVPTAEWLGRFWVVSGKFLPWLTLSQISKVLAATSSLHIQYMKDLTRASPDLVPKIWARQALSILSGLLRDAGSEEGYDADDQNLSSYIVPVHLILRLSWAMSTCNRLFPSDLVLRTRLLEVSKSSIEAALDKKSKIPKVESHRMISHLPIFLAASGCSRAVDRSGLSKILFSFCLSCGPQLDLPSLARLLSGIEAMGYTPRQRFISGVLSMLKSKMGMVKKIDPDALSNLLFAIRKLVRKTLHKGLTAGPSTFSPTHLQDMKEAVLLALKSGAFRDPDTPLRLLLTLANLNALHAHAGQKDEEIWWKGVYVALDTHLDALSPSSLPSLLYLIASTVVASKKKLFPVPSPDARFVDRVMERVLSGLHGLDDAEEVARVLCGLVGLGGARWLPQVSYKIEANSASFCRADHLVIQKAWMRMGVRDN